MQLRSELLMHALLKHMIILFVCYTVCIAQGCIGWHFACVGEVASGGK